MNRTKLTDESGEFRELNREYLINMVPFSALPASLQTRPKKIGRPVLKNKKTAISIRLDADVLDAIKATGDGWQTRMNDALRSLFVHRQ